MPPGYLTQVYLLTSYLEIGVEGGVWAGTLEVIHSWGGVGSDPDSDRRWGVDEPSFAILLNIYIGGICLPPRQRIGGAECMFSLSPLRGAAAGGAPPLPASLSGSSISK